MNKQLISTESSFENAIGYSRAVVQGDWVFVSGTTGYEYETMTISDDIVDQCNQCMKNIVQTLDRAGAHIDDIVRVTYIVPSALEFEKCWPTLKKYFGEIRPAATMFSAKLAKQEMKIEIEVTALKK